MIHILKNKKNIVIGLNSGTSADSLDMAAIEIDRSRNKYAIRYIAGLEKKFPPMIKNEILHIADSQKPTIDSIIYLDNILGEFFSKSVTKFITILQKQNITVNAISSHGQTIRHLPKKVKKFGFSINGTLQIGSSDFIAQQSNLPVVSDFRQADIAMGGEGAPITTEAMATMYTDTKKSKLIINIGGMSNFFYLPSIISKENSVAKDCGPGNVLSDLLMRKLFQKEYDKNGKTARSGTISRRLLTILTSDLFTNEKENSTGRERFGMHTIDRLLKKATTLKISDADIVTTSVEFTVYSIFHAIKKLIKNKKIEKLYLTGGGRKNIFLVERLQSYLSHCQIKNIDTLGIDGDFVEATAYAVMGEAALHGKSVHLVKNKKIHPIYGKITLPPVRG